MVLLQAVCEELMELSAHNLQGYIVAKKAELLRGAVKFFDSAARAHGS
jgi:hypothetical protein